MSARRILILFSVAALVLSSCSAKTGTAGEHGPLAVLDDQARGESTSLGGSGRLNVTDRCVELELTATGARRLLTWRSPQVAWTSDAIAFTTANGDRLTLGGGDSVTVSGEDLVGDEPVERDLRWIAAPDASCSRDVFVVHDVRLVVP